MTFNTVKHGHNLNKVPLMAFDNFFLQLTYQRQVPKIDINVRELYNDSIFTYFGKYTTGFFSSTPLFFKVYTDTLSTRLPNYNTFYGQELMFFLREEVIPQEERLLWDKNTTTHPNQRKANCSTQTNKMNYSYELLDKKVALTINWDTDCPELAIFKGKKYQAYYNLITKQFEK